MRCSFCAAMAGASGVSLISGGQRLYKIKGVAMREMNAGKLAAWNQKSHGFEITTPTSSASLRQSRFWAAAVRNRALELPEDCAATSKS